MLALCRRLGLAVVAEGIETEEQAEWLRARQCEFGQGYLFHRAAAGTEVRAFIAGEVKDAPLLSPDPAGVGTR